MTTALDPTRQPDAGLLSRAVGSVRNVLDRMGALTTGLVVSFWFVTIIRAIPVPKDDYGMFVTVAERLKAGDRLYVDVFENKDPFFHYVLALGRSVTPYAGWLLEVLWLLVAAISAYVIAREAGIAFRTSVVVGFISVPAIMTGFSYWAGVSHVPGVALTILVMALALRMHGLLAGLVVGALLFFKLVMFPIGLLFVVLVFTLRGRPRQLAVAAMAALGAIVVSVALMSARGELLAYVSTLQDNAVYAATQETSTGIGAALEHLRTVLVPNNALRLLTLVGLLVATVALNPRIVRRSSDPTGAVLVWSSFGATVVALGALARTGLWIHHGQILIPGAVLALVLFLSRGPRFTRGSSAAAIWTALAVTVPLTGLPSPSIYVTPIQYARANVWEQTRVPGETAAILSTGDPTSFARVGGANEGGFGQGLGEWTLACPRFEQSQYQNPASLADTLECLPSARVILTRDDAVPLEGEDRWNEFLAGVESLLAADYSCELFEYGRICVRND